MKEKHSGINKKINNKTKALLALLIATAFILPAGAIMGIDPAIESAKKNRPDSVDPARFDEVGYPNDPQPKPSTGDFDTISVVDLDTGQTIGEMKPTPTDPTGRGGPEAGRGKFYAYNAYGAGSGIAQGPITFDDPGAITLLQATPQIYFMSGGCFVGDDLYMCEFSYANLYTVDTTTGDPVYVANTGTYFNGIAYDHTTDTMYGASSTSLYEVDYTTGAITMIGSFGSGTMIGIACDSQGNMYGVDVSFGTQNYLYSINKATGAATVVGGLGHSLLYAQDIGFDKGTDTLYHAAYFDDGTPSGLYTIDTSTAQMTLVGDFPGGMEVDALAIPGMGGPPAPEHEWNAVVKYIYIEDEIWDPDLGDYKIIPKIIHTSHDQECKNEYLHEWVEPWIAAYAPDPNARCNQFPPGELYVGAEIGNHGNHTYYNLPVHLNVWKQIYDEILVSDFESHVFSDWVAIDGGGCVHPYPDGDTWTPSTARYHSAGTSMHVSKTASYMKGANDTLRNRYPLNTHGGDCAEISFWFWVEGDYDPYPWKAYDYLTVYWVQRPHSGPEIRHGPLDVRVVEPGPVWYWSQQTDWGLWGGDHGQPLCYNSGGPAPVGGNYNDPEWSKGIITIPDEWKCDQTFIEFVWKADCMDQYEGAYIDDVVISRVINQGEKVYSAHEQVTLTPGEQKFLRFTPPWGECCVMDHGKYWIECRVKTHSNFVADEVPEDDWIKDEVIIKCHHDVGVTNVDVWPHKQQAGDVFSYLVPTNVSFTVKNYSPYDDEFDVKMTVHNMEYDIEKFFDDVESGNKGWDHFAFGGSPDLWHITTRDAESPTHSWACMEEDVGFYDNDMSNYLVSPTLNLEGLKDAYVCWDAKWSIAPGDTWGWCIYDPYSNFVIRFGGSPADMGYGVSGEWLPDFDGHPDWIGPKNPGQFQFITGGDGALRYYGMCMPLMHIVEYLNDIGPGWLGIEMFGPHGDPEYRAGFGFYLSSDGSIRENPVNVEKWSGLFIDDVRVIAVEPGQVVAEETWHVMLPAQGGEQTITTKYCWEGIYGDFEVDIETLLETDCNPDNNWMDGYNHIYYIDWADDVEEYTYYDEHPYEDGWTHEDLRQQGESNWHIVENIDPVEGYQHYWWHGIEGDTLYGPNTNDMLISPEFDLYSLIPREPWQMAAVQLVFRMCAHIDIGDAFYVEASNDSGRNWQILEQWDGPWQSDCWHDIEILIPQYKYTKGFMFRFRFESDGLWENKGVLLDDIILQGLKGKNATIHEIILKEENFGELPPWPAECIAELVDYSGDGVLWEGTDSHWAGGPPGASGLFAIADSDANYGDHVQTGMITCTVDLTGYTTATLEFDNDFYSYSFYDQIGQVLVDGNVEAEYQFGSYYGHETIDLTAYAGLSDVEIEFYFDDYDEWSYHWAIDNVIVSGDGGIAYEQNFGETDIPWPPEDPWTLEDYNGDGYTWMPMLAGTWKEPKDAEDYFAIADSDGNMGVVWSDGIKSEPIDIAGAVPDDPLVLFLGATLDVDCQYQEYGSNPDNEWGEIRAWSGGSYQTLAMYNTDQGQFHETLNLPLADDVQIEFFYDTGGDDFEWFFSVDNVVVTVTYEEYELGDPLVWYFEDDAETGGNPLWTAVPDYGGDLWRPYCYPIYHDPVYGPNGEIVSPILEPCPDENYLPNSEPWLFPPPDGEHFWLLEKHHKKPYFDGVNTWGYCEYSYLNNMDNILISPELDLSGIYHAHLVFYVNGALGDGDEFWVCVREKNPDGTWGPWNWMHRVTPFFTWDLINQVDDYINYNHPIGATPAFMVNLQEYVIDQGTIQVGFRLVSDDSDVGEGIKLDHIKLDVKRDDVAPLTTCTITGTKGCNDWYTSDVTVKLSAEDDLVGVKDIFYRIDGGAWQVYNERVQVSADGEHSVEFYAVDEVGNAEEIKTCQAFKIDQTAPTVALSMPESGYLYLFGRPVFQLGRTIVIGDLTAQASASDATSGIDYVEFLVDGEVKSADLTAPFTFDLPKGGLLPASHTLQVKAYDNACNAATGTQTTYLKWF